MKQCVADAHGRKTALFLPGLIVESAALQIPFYIVLTTQEILFTFFILEK